jgi:hypothetical protein
MYSYSLAVRRKCHGFRWFQHSIKVRIPFKVRFNESPGRFRESNHFARGRRSTECIRLKLLRLTVCEFCTICDLIVYAIIVLIVSPAARNRTLMEISVDIILGALIRAIGVDSFNSFSKPLRKTSTLG